MKEGVEVGQGVLGRGQEEERLPNGMEPGLCRPPKQVTTTARTGSEKYIK